jgi:hypothetical protein
MGRVLPQGKTASFFLEVVMPKSNICSILELPDLVVDSCITDDSCNLIFCSIWGRDTAVQEILARITLNPSENLSLQSITIDGEGVHSPVYFNKELLEKKAARSYPGTLFGNMTHLWLFDKRVMEPDYANHSAYLLYGPNDDTATRVWPLICDLAPYPLPDHWKSEVFRIVVLQDMLIRMKTVLGNTTGYKIDLNVDLIQSAVSRLIRDGKLSAVSA